MTLWKIINEEDADSIPKNRGEKFPADFLYSEFFGAGLSRYAANPLIFVLSTGHNQVSNMVTNRERKLFGSLKKIPKAAQTTANVDVYVPCSGISGPTSQGTSACPNLHERWPQPSHVRCPVPRLLIYSKSVGLPRLDHEFEQ